MFRWVLRRRGPDFQHQTAVTVRQCVYCFGSNRQIKVHVFNTVALNWRKLTPVATRSEHRTDVPSMQWGYTAVLVPEDTVLICGGYQGGKYNSVLYGFDVDNHRWFKPQVSGTRPGGRSHCSACVLGKMMYVHGGYHWRLTYTNDTYKLDTSTMVWSLINIRGISPPDSTEHSATIIGTKMFIFGGWSLGWDEDNSLRVFDTENDRWLDTPSIQLHPGEPCGHAAFAYNGELYIGDYWSENSNRNLWKINPETFSSNVVNIKGKVPCLDDIRFCFKMGDCVVFKRHNCRELYILDLNPSLKTLCKLCVIQHVLEQTELPPNLRWELAAMTANTATKHNTKNKNKGPSRFT